MIMKQTTKKMLNAYMNSQKFRSPAGSMDTMKEMFRGVLQQVIPI